MRHKVLRFGEGFNVVLGNRRSQAAQMVLAPGKSEGNAENRHRGSDQWLFVLSGNGVARVNAAQHKLRPGSLLLVEHGDRHEIRNNGTAKLVTLNFYVPPAFTAGGDELSAGKPGERAEPRRRATSRRARA